jgi:hypothetical protein
VRLARRIAIPRRKNASQRETITALTWSRLVASERADREHARFVVENDVKNNRQEIDLAHRNRLRAARGCRAPSPTIIAAAFLCPPKFLTAIRASAASSRPALRSRADASRPAT